MLRLWDLLEFLPTFLTLFGCIQTSVSMGQDSAILNPEARAMTRLRATYAPGSLPIQLRWSEANTPSDLGSITEPGCKSEISLAISSAPLVSKTARSRR